MIFLLHEYILYLTMTRARENICKLLPRCEIYMQFICNYLIKLNDNSDNLLSESHVASWNHIFLDNKYHTVIHVQKSGSRGKCIQF